MRRALIALVVVALALGAGVVGVRAVWRSVFDHVAAGCRFGDVRTDTDQAAVAAEMVSVVVSRQLPDRAAVLVLAAGLQESKLRNLAAGAGDRDSVGVLQQRPSQGWGTSKELTDIRYATGAFLDKLVKSRTWTTDPLAEAIQKVQISADGTAYAQHEAQAQRMADALTGRTVRAIRCTFATSAVLPASTVAARLAADLPVNRPVAAAERITVAGAGWATAAWLVAHGEQFGIESVTCRGARWERSKGWADDPSDPPGAVIATMGARG